MQDFLAFLSSSFVVVEVVAYHLKELAVPSAELSSFAVAWQPSVVDSFVVVEVLIDVSAVIAA